MLMFKLLYRGVTRLPGASGQNKKDTLFFLLSRENYYPINNELFNEMKYGQKTHLKRDEIAKTALTYAESETVNQSLSNALEGFAESLSALGDYGDARAQNIDAKVVAELSKYEQICKSAKEEVKEIYAVRDKELTRRKQLDRIRERNPRQRQQIIQAETELVKATAEVSKSIHNLEEKTTRFEKQKLHDIKKILLDFIAVEIGYHAKALEVFTKAYNDVNTINEERDLEELKKSLHSTDKTQHKFSSKRPIFRSSGSLGSLGTIFTSQYKKTPGIPDSKKFSKSEETLDSMKRSSSESDSEEESEDDETMSSDEDKVSPIMVRKSRKSLD
nr:unnamed protein product [Callosobruchus chinensis]